MAKSDHPVLIPARGGSTRLPGKNLMQILGQSLIERTVMAALPHVPRELIYVSTDDDEIADEAWRLDVQVIERPDYLANATATAKSVAIHALETGLKGSNTFIYMQPTSPLRRSSDLLACIETFESHPCNTVVTVTKSALPPGRFWKEEEGRMVPYFEGADPFLRRQEQRVAYCPNGAVYVCRTQSFLESTEDSFLIDPVITHIMPAALSIDIDTLYDLTLARIWAKRGVNGDNS